MSGSLLPLALELARVALGFGQVGQQGRELAQLYPEFAVVRSLFEQACASVEGAYGEEA